MPIHKVTPRDPAHSGVNQDHKAEVKTSSALGHVWSSIKGFFNAIGSTVSHIFFSIFPVKSKDIDVEHEKTGTSEQTNTSPNASPVIGPAKPGLKERFANGMNAAARRVDVMTNKYPGATDLGVLSNVAVYIPKEECFKNANEKIRKRGKIPGVELPAQLGPKNVTRDWDDGICSGMGMMLAKNIILNGLSPREAIKALKEESARTEAAGYQLMCETADVIPIQCRTSYICDTLMHLKFVKGADISNILFLMDKRDNELFIEIKKELKERGIDENTIAELLDTSKASEEIKKIGMVKAYNLSPDTLDIVTEKIKDKNSLEYIYLNALCSRNPLSSLFFKPPAALEKFISKEETNDLRNDLLERALHQAEGMDAVLLPHIFRTTGKPELDTDAKMLENFKKCGNGVYAVEIYVKDPKTGESISHHITFAKLEEGGKTTYTIMDPNDVYPVLQFTDETKALNSLNLIISEYPLRAGRKNHNIRVKLIS